VKEGISNKSGKVEFWSSTEYSGFLAGLIRELSDTGVDARQCFQISEASYRSAKSTPARLFLRFRQYVAYPAQLITALGMQKLFRAKRQDRALGEPDQAEGGNSDKKRHSESDSGLRSQVSALSPQPSALCPSDVCVVSTNTFYAPLIATYLHPNVVHLVYDLFPEAMIHSGKWQEGTLKVKVVRWITQLTLKRSAMNVFLGPRLKDYVESIHGPVPNSAIIAVGADQALFGRSPKERLGRAEGGDLGRAEGGDLGRAEGGDLAGCFAVAAQSSPTILYCGNFGNMHDSETLFSYWREYAQKSEDREQKPESQSLKDSTTSPLNLRTPQQLNPSTHQPLSSLSSALRPLSKTTWLFCCSGPKRAALESERVGLPDVLRNRIHLGGGLSQRDWIATMESADVALVTMTPGSETVVMPSKTYSAMMAGQAILAIAPENSDLVDLIKQADCGWWVEPGDVAGLNAALEAISLDSVDLLEKRERAFTYAHEHFGQDQLAQQWIRVFAVLR
jgi:glycosyltransferase involved in cell wall biosynthesis